MSKSVLSYAFFAGIGGWLIFFSPYSHASDNSSKANFDILLMKAVDLNDADAQYELGIMLKNSQGVEKDESEAVKWFKKAANQGHAEAQHNLAIMLEDGRGAEKNEAEAVRWYTKAAEQGHTRAQYNLAFMLVDGRGVEKNEIEAVRWFKKSAEQGDIDAQHSLAVMLANGRGVEKDETEAVRWYTKAAEQGNADAQHNLAIMLKNGRGVEKDEAEAVRWYTKAAEQGHTSAQYSLACMLVDGRGVEKNEIEAVRWFKKSAEQGNASAQFNLAFMLEKGRGTEKDEAEAVRWYTKAANQGFVKAKRHLAIMLKNKAEAVRWYTKAAEQGDADTQYNLAFMLQYGEGVEKDEAEAVRWYMKAANQGHAKAQYNLAVMLRFGEGVEKDEAEAVRWYMKAANQGHAEAQSDLALMLVLGREVKKDEVEAVRWFKKAAKQGDIDAQYWLAVMLRSGQGVEKNGTEAVRWFKKAAEQGMVLAQYRLALILQTGRGIEKDEAEAVKWFKKAAKQGYAKAQYGLAVMLANGQGVEKDEAEAVRWFKKAAKQGDTNAQNNLAIILKNRRCIKQDEAETTRWLKKTPQQELKEDSQVYNLRTLNRATVDLSDEYIDYERAKDLSYNTTITSLTLGAFNLASPIITALANNKNLKSLTLSCQSTSLPSAHSNTKLNKGDILSLQALMQHPSITYLNLNLSSLQKLDSNLALVKEEMPLAIRGLEGNTALTSLDLICSCPITVHEANILTELPALRKLSLNMVHAEINAVKILFSNSHLIELSLKQNPVLEHFFNFWFKDLKFLSSHSNLIALDLSDNNADDSVAKVIAKNSNLRSLNLSNLNSIATSNFWNHGDGYKAHRESINSGKLSQQTIKAYSKLNRPGISASGAIALSQNTALTDLDITHNNIRDKGIRAFKNHPSLTKLNAASNGISAKGFAEISENSSLTFLNLSGNNPLKETITFHNNNMFKTLILNSCHISLSTIRSIVPHLSNITRLDLSNNSIDDCGAKVLAACKTLQQLDLSSNLLSCEGKSSLLKSHSIKYLNIFDNRLFDNLDKNIMSDKIIKAIAQNRSLTDLRIDVNCREIARLLAEVVAFHPTLKYRNIAQDACKNAKYHIQSTYWHRIRELRNNRLTEQQEKKVAPSPFKLNAQMQAVKSAAERGDAKAQYELAHAYYYAPKFAKGIFWFEKSASQGHPPAQLFLARLYEKGENVQRNHSLACKWYIKALHQREEKAFLGLKNLARNGCLEACYALGQACERGQGVVVQDLQQARQWYEMSANRNHAPSLYALGFLYEDSQDQQFTDADTIIATYQQAYEYYNQACKLNFPQASFALSRVAQTSESLKVLKKPEIKRNLLLRKLQSALPHSLSPDVLYKMAYLAEIIRVGFNEGPQDALFQALYDLGHFPRQSRQSRAVLDMLIRLVDSEEFNAEGYESEEDAFRVTALGRICRGIHLIKEPSTLIAPSQAPKRLRVVEEGLRDVRIEVFNCLFKENQAICHWPAFEQSVNHMLQAFDQGMREGKITPAMLYDKEFDTQGTRRTLEDLLRGGEVGRPSVRFANRLIQIEPLLFQLEEDTRLAQLASWAIAGLHCTTRAEEETYGFYVRYTSEAPQILEMRIALCLADLRKQLISDLVPTNEEERLHQIAYLEKKVGPLLAIVGDAEEFQDKYEQIVKARYKGLAPEAIFQHVEAHYTVDHLAKCIADSVNKGTHLPYMYLAKTLEERRSNIDLTEFYDEAITTFTTQGAKALLYSTGYLEEDH